MSEQNVPPHWKRDDGITSNSGGFYPKTDVAAAVAVAATSARGGESTSSSSFSIAGPSNLSGDIFPQQQHIELQKLSNISKINSLAKISGLDGITEMPEEEKLKKFQQIVEAGVGDHAKQQILQILDKVSLLKPPERLLLYLRMPGGTPETDPLRQPQNPLGTRSEINHTINWVRSHLEHDPKVSIPKQDVYNDYISYCDRVDIKPLSTADFGKVMKQVFPEIRPRRLGTRGHSRYCYAAMRKATKLDPPRLPDLNANSNVGDFNGIMDEDSWKIIKMWAEGLLNSNFNSLKDLANHIMKHHLNSPASNSSRLLLQKKLLQRDAKEKRKFTDTSPLKKRRKKKRRSSSSSESVQQAPILPLDETLVSVKKEVIDPSQPQPTQVQSSVVQVQPQQQLLPMNLATEHDNNNIQKIQGTNLACDNNLVVGCSTKNTVAPNLSPICAPTIKDSSKVSVNQQNLIKLPLNSVKEEIPDDYHQNILCKKVRQAQQAKGIWNPSTTIPPSIDNSPIANIQPYVRVNDGLMGPPAQLDLHSEHSGFKRALQSNGISMIKSSSPYLQLRAKKVRCAPNRMDPMQDEQHQGLKEGEKDVLPENLGIPRERVISICNMDKHELDDYLNEEENSQDQEAELLQYFQQEDSEEKPNNNDNGSINMASTQNAFPILENYQLYGNSKNEKKSAVQNEQDNINQLRFVLQQNLQNNNNNNKYADGQVINKSPLEQQSGSFTGVYPGGSASASLALMSQRHNTVIPDDAAGIRCCPSNNDIHQAPPSNNSALRGPRRKINLSARSCVPHSPSTRRKNCSFVPISPNANSQINSLDYSPFVSPRSTPVVRKPPLHKQQSLPAPDHNLSDPILGSVNNTFSKSLNFQNVISSSAPPSPSLVQQRFRFAPNTTLQAGSSATSSAINSDHQFNLFQSVDMHHRVQNINNCSMDGSGESRSQSVPLHCRNSPAFNHSSNFPGFSSACSSVAQTPVPPEFTDFSDPSSILDIFSDSSQQHQPVKLEENEIVPSILDHMVTSESVIGVPDFISQEFDIKNNNSTNSISRSVPSSPLPQMGYGKCKNSGGACNDSDKYNKLYDISKSVPTTPVAMNIAQFRYSPEFNRDYLINGNTVDSGKVSSFYSQQQQQPSRQQPPTGGTESVADKVIPTSLPENIDELSTFGDVTESIIGSDILNNL